MFMGRHSCLNPPAQAARRPSTKESVKLQPPRCSSCRGWREGRGLKPMGKKELHLVKWKRRANESARGLCGNPERHSPKCHSPKR